MKMHFNFQRPPVLLTVVLTACMSSLGCLGGVLWGVFWWLGWVGGWFLFWFGFFDYLCPYLSICLRKGLQDLSQHGVVLVGGLWTLHLGPETNHLGVCTFCSFEVHVCWEGVSITRQKSQETKMFRCLLGLWEDLCHGSSDCIWYGKFFQLHHFIFLSFSLTYPAFTSGATSFAK